MTIFYNHHDISYFLTAGIVPSDRCTVVPGSGIATNKFRKDKILPEELLLVRKDLNLKDGEIVVIMIARICRSKGVLEFAQAAEIVRQKMPWVRFILVGPVDDNALDRLSALEMDYICKSVTWVGVRKDIEPILAVSDVFALPTYREGIPRVLLEAASMSLPIVATDTPGCQEVVQHEVNGFLIPTRDAEALAREIERLAENNKLRASFGAASRKLAITEFDIEIISEKIANLYCYCMNNINTRSLCPAKPEKVIIA